MVKFKISFRKGVRLILRLKFGKMLLDKVRPKFFSAIA